MKFISSGRLMGGYNIGVEGGKREGERSVLLMG